MLNKWLSWEYAQWYFENRYTSHPKPGYQELYQDALVPQDPVIEVRALTTWVFQVPEQMSQNTTLYFPMLYFPPTRGSLAQLRKWFVWAFARIVHFHMPKRTNNFQKVKVDDIGHVGKAAIARSPNTSGVCPRMTLKKERDKKMQKKSAKETQETPKNAKKNCVLNKILEELPWMCTFCWGGLRKSSTSASFCIRFAIC